ncbi:cytochrome C [Sulfitobacter donghicola DSW-25 = KCTC 12864 = JCM 14565]|uniref:Cytochrome C n=1 Tax=Sulfitobacter donghicola DSW-25 = KCTC 12864 = JCM 14565 TaxID=1300350 RepID=A0A073IKS7_9RHOB|nr:c-type cytochrome biogenesis protein CcmI [Sulfitobacter donghicola]KEJ90086.1 cytochrome C [Sulfitobacter donghicola DSW-25 = KCTC 12864 = JCM 14565]
MSFWIVAITITLMVGAVLARAVIRGGQKEIASRAASDVEVYRAQLEEVDRDVARGVIEKADAERVHAEIARRLIAADKAQSNEETSRANTPAKAAVFIILVGLIGSATAYWFLGAPGYGDMALKDRIAFAEEVRKSRPAQADAEGSLPPFVEPAQMDERYKELLKQLRTTVATRPDDVKGHALLAQQERRIGNFVAAKDAQNRLLKLKADQVTPQDLADFGELQVLSAGGYVSPEAEMSLRAALVKEPQNGSARYYIGLMLAQTGRPDQAFRIWDGLLRAGPEDAPWIPPILEQIEGLAQLAGVRYSLPDIGSAAAKGPSAEDVENAQDMTPAERMEMIGGMVAGLSERLATEGGPARDWARLISSLGVLGEVERAQAIHANALEAFANDNEALDLINAAGRKAGVAE